MHPITTLAIARERHRDMLRAASRRRHSSSEPTPPTRAEAIRRPRPWLRPGMVRAA